MDNVSRPSVLAELTLPGVFTHSSKTWSETIKIPNDSTLCNLKHCGISSEEYELNVITTIYIFYRTLISFFLF